MTLTNRVRFTGQNKCYITDGISYVDNKPTKTTNYVVEKFQSKVRNHSLISQLIPLNPKLQSQV